MNSSRAMNTWHVYEERSYTRPATYEVIRIKKRDSKESKPEDFFRLGNICKFKDVKQALTLKNKLNELEKEGEKL